MLDSGGLVEVPRDDSIVPPVLSAIPQSVLPF